MRESAQDDARLLDNPRRRCFNFHLTRIAEHYPSTPHKFPSKGCRDGSDKALRWRHAIEQLCPVQLSLSRPRTTCHFGRQLFDHFVRTVRCPCMQMSSGPKWKIRSHRRHLLRFPSSWKRTLQVISMRSLSPFHDWWCAQSDVRRHANRSADGRASANNKKFTPLHWSRPATVEMLPIVRKSMRADIVSGDPLATTSSDLSSACSAIRQCCADISAICLSQKCCTNTCWFWLLLWWLPSVTLGSLTAAFVRWRCWTLPSSKRVVGQQTGLVRFAESPSSFLHSIIISRGEECDIDFSKRK